MLKLALCKTLSTFAMSPRMVAIPMDKKYADMSEAELKVCAAALGGGGREKIDKAIDQTRFLRGEGTEPPPEPAQRQLYVEVDVPTDEETVGASASSAGASADDRKIEELIGPLQDPEAEKSVEVKVTDKATKPSPKSNARLTTTKSARPSGTRTMPRSGPGQGLPRRQQSMRE